jgi:hypothetical protein
MMTDQLGDAADQATDKSDAKDKTPGTLREAFSKAVRDIFAPVIDQLIKLVGEALAAYAREQGPRLIQEGLKHATARFAQLTDADESEEEEYEEEEEEEYEEEEEEEYEEEEEEEPKPKARPKRRPKPKRRPRREA